MNQSICSIDDGDSKEKEERRRFFKLFCNNITFQANIYLNETKILYIFL